MNIEEFSKNIENKINEKKLTPTPRWHFLMKNSVIWLFALLTTFLGSLAVATIIFVLTDHDWDVFNYLDRTLFEHIFISIPYIWLIVLTLLTIVTRYNVTHTKRGYRYKTSMVVLGSILSSIIFGGIFFSLGIDSEIHELFLQQIPIYKKSIYTNDDIWIFPERGLISGVINSINNNDITIVDQNNSIWKIVISKETRLQNISPLYVGEKIKITGEQKATNEFFASTIRPWNKGDERK